MYLLPYELPATIALEEYLKFLSWKGGHSDKGLHSDDNSGFCRKNRVELPREKITHDLEMVTKTATEQSFVKPDEIWRIIDDGHVPVRDKAIIATLLTLRADEITNL